MGCDFYIHVYLEIEHNDGISYIELPIIRGYYCDLDCGIYDSDDDENNYYYNSKEYKKLYENMKKICLTPRKPVIIYNNHSFISPKFEEKYLSIIQDKINNDYINRYDLYIDTGILTGLDQIIKITKKEENQDDLSCDCNICKEINQSYNFQPK